MEARPENLDTGPSGASGSVSPAARWLPWVVLLGAVIVTGWVRWRMLGASLERDEGGYAYMARELIRGVPPFVSGYSMHMPVLYLIYAGFFLLFGETAEAIRTGLWIVNLATAAGIFLCSRRLMNGRAGIFAAAFFLLLSAGRWVDGLNANSEHFVIAFTVWGLFLALGPDRKSENGSPVRDYLPGLMLGLAFLTKQTAVVFAVPVLLAQLFNGNATDPRERLVSFVRFAAGWSLPVVAVFLWMAADSDFERFWFWTFTYPLFYGVSAPRDGALAWMSKSFVRTALPMAGIWLLAGAGIFFLFRRGTSGLSVLLLLVMSLLAVMQGFYFRPHYFLYLAPPLALLAGLFLAGVEPAVARRTSASAAVIALSAVAAAVVAHAGATHRRPWFRLTPDEYIRLAYTTNPFPESPRVAEWIRGVTAPGAKVAILGSEPQILFYADRQSASPYIYTYALVERAQFALEMQQEMAVQIEAAHPDVLVAVSGYASWAAAPGAPDYLFHWLDTYLANYEKSGVVDIIDYRDTVYVFGEAAKTYVPRKGFRMDLYLRKPATVPDSAGSAPTTPPSEAP